MEKAAARTNLMNLQFKGLPKVRRDQMVQNNLFALRTGDGTNDDALAFTVAMFLQCSLALFLRCSCNVLALRSCVCGQI